MSDLLDESTTLREKRGTTVMVLCILSWVWLGLSTLGFLVTVTQGPATPEEMVAEKLVIMQAATPEVIAVFGEEFITDQVVLLEIANEYFYSLRGIDAVTLVLGFYAVWLMFNLKKKGYYFYLAYSLLPIITIPIFYGMGGLMVLSMLMIAVLSAVFCILYGVQLKRMS